MGEENLQLNLKVLRRINILMMCLKILQGISPGEITSIFFILTKILKH